MATVGELTTFPGASNVIPGEVRLSLDVRHATDAERDRAVAELQRSAGDIAAQRNVTLHWEIVHQTAAVPCDPVLTALLENAAQRRQREVPRLASGAGHDAAALAAICPVAMLFVRCQGGVSHHPAESVTADDVGVAVEVLGDFLNEVAGTRQPRAAR